MPLPLIPPPLPPPHAALVMQPPALGNSSSTSSSLSSSYFHQQQLQSHQPPPQVGGSCYGIRRADFEGAFYGKSNFHGCVAKNNFEHIPASQSSVPGTAGSASLLEDETIVLTEDEDETVVSSHDYNEYATDDEGGTGVEAEAEADGDGDGEDEDTIQVHDDDDEAELATASSAVAMANEEEVDDDDNNDDDDDEEEVFVDILSNDDDELPPLTQGELPETKALKRNELLYEDEELHHQAVDGLAKLFDRDFRPTAKEALVAEAEAALAEEQSQTEKIYLDLSGSPAAESPSSQSNLNLNHPSTHLPPPHAPTHSPVQQQRKQKTERRRTKLRKHAAIDEETISPVSGTIIRKLRDDEELVVRKGDIDPAFNVVEITEEAKAILASIDNKIGDYLCQLCRTVYDDAFMLAQHRCPRIVHIEYKCSECEKVTLSLIYDMCRGLRCQQVGNWTIQCVEERIFCISKDSLTLHGSFSVSIPV